MTLDLDAATSVRDATTAAASAVASALPLPARPEAAQEHAPAATLVPGAGSKAVRCSVSGPVRGSLAVVVAAAMSDELWATTGATDAATQLAGALAAAEGALQALVPGLQLDAAEAVDPATVAGGCSVRLTGDAHAATVVLDLAPVEPSVPSPRATAEGTTPPAAAAGPARPRPVLSTPLDLLQDVEMEVAAELGRTRLTVRDLLGLTPGAVVELDRAAGSPVDVLVNGTLIARGEVVVVDEEYGIRITEVVGADGEGAAPDMPAAG
jgi:flagellar motor switch protein FliN